MEDNLAMTVKYPALRGMNQFVIVAANEQDFREQARARTQEGWEGPIRVPREYPCVARGYEDRDGWRLIWIACFYGDELRCYKVVEHVWGKGKPYPKTALAGQMKAQTMGTARSRLGDLSWVSKNK